MDILFGIIALIVVVFVPIAFVHACFNQERMPSVINEKPDTFRPISFWRRQIHFETTTKQKVFDWIFGVILPVICFAFDPIVFKVTDFGKPFFGEYKPFAYLLSFISILAMMAWLIWGKKLKGLSGILSGLFAVGGIISLGIGIILFPFSVIGLIVLIGALGFTPLFTSIVFLRNAYRSFQISKPFFENRVLLDTTILSAMFGLIVPFTINVQVNNFVRETIRSDAETIKSNAWKFKIISPIADFGNLRGEYNISKNNRQKQTELAILYFELTGKEIEKRSYETFP